MTAPVTDEVGATGRRAPFLGLLAAHGLSLVGNSVSGVALPWLVLETTGSAAKTGLAAFVGAVPLVLGAVLGGPVVDRFGHRRVSVAADLASMVAVAAIPLLAATGGVAYWQLLLLVGVGALLDAPGATARKVLLPEVADAAEVRRERANAFYETIQGGALLLGPPLAGLLIAGLGAAWVLLVTTAAFALSATVVSVVVPPSAGGRPGRRSATEVADGLRFLRRDRPIRALVTYATLMLLFVGPLLAVVMPVYAGGLGKPLLLGFFVAAIGGGTIVGALAYGWAGHRFRRRGLFVGGMVGVGLAVAALATLPPLPLLLGTAFVGGLASGPINPLLNTVLQDRVPAALRGRVFGTVTALSLAGSPLGMLAAGPALETFGVRATLVGMATGILMVAAASVRDRSLRGIDTGRAPADGRRATTAADDGIDRRRQWPATLRDKREERRWTG